MGINGNFAPWVGALIADVNQPIILVTELGFEEETITRLSRVGFDNIIGHLDGGFQAWKKAGYDMDTVNRISAIQFAALMKTGNDKIIAVRKASEYEAEHVEDAFSKPLAYINEWVESVDSEAHFYMHCAGGYRSMITASILQARGYRNFTEIEGGFNAIAATTIPKTAFVCQSKIFNSQS
jgi:hydroxyacylglutathione hydrolase